MVLCTILGTFYCRGVNCFLKREGGGLVMQAPSILIKSGAIASPAPFYWRPCTETPPWFFCTKITARLRKGLWKTNIFWHPIIENKNRKWKWKKKKHIPANVLTFDLQFLHFPVHNIYLFNAKFSKEKKNTGENGLLQSMKPCSEIPFLFMDPCYGCPMNDTNMVSMEVILKSMLHHTLPTWFHNNFWLSHTT